MARNVEKANLMLNKWNSMKEAMEKGPGKERRPFLASECQSLPDAERWRREVLREVTSRVADIQNGELSAWLRWLHSKRRRLRL